MKEMSVEELIVKCGVGWNDFKAELLRRFEVLKDIGVERDNALVAYEGSKCCGNCKHSKDSWEGTLCDKRKEAIHCGDYRDCWQSDGLTRAEREGK